MWKQEPDGAATDEMGPVGGTETQINAHETYHTNETESQWRKLIETRQKFKVQTQDSE